MNYTDAETPWTRIIEHKWFEFGKDEEGNDLPKTVISREYSSEWKLGDEPYYPVNDEKNGKLYEEYKKLAEKEENIIFGGRLGEYKYYDMDKVIKTLSNVFVFKCPVCGKYTFQSGPGSYEICPVCGWEDDKAQYKDPNLKGGANRFSLKEYKEQYEKNHQ